MNFNEMTPPQKMKILQLEKTIKAATKSELNTTSVNLLLFKLFDAKTFDDVYSVINWAMAAYSANIVLAALKKYKGM